MRAGGRDVRATGGPRKFKDTPLRAFVAIVESRSIRAGVTHALGVLHTRDDQYPPFACQVSRVGTRFAPPA